MSTPTTLGDPRAVVIGSALIDDVETDDGVQEYLGGTGFNLAVALSQMRVRTALVANFADDEEGLALLAALERIGVALLRPPTLTGTRHATSRLLDGEPQYQFSDDAHRRVVFTDQVQHAMGRAEVIAVNSFPFESTEDVQRLVVALEHSPGLHVIDPNPRPDLLKDARLLARHLDWVLPLAHIVKFSADDLVLLYGSSARRALDRALSRGTQLVVLTRGSRGAEILTSSGESYVSPAAPLHGALVDTIGAGDAALAAVIAAALDDPVMINSPAPKPRLERLDWQSHLRTAMEEAARCCCHAGGPADTVFQPSRATPPRHEAALEAQQPNGGRRR